MSNRLDDSIGSELVADDEKSIHERLNNNSISAYKIKMKSDLQFIKEDYNYKDSQISSKITILSNKSIFNFITIKTI